MPDPLRVRLLVADIGEVKEWAMEGKDDVVFSSWDEDTTEVFWQVESLPLALNLVPDVMDAIERLRGRGEHVEVVVRSAGKAQPFGTNNARTEASDGGHEPSISDLIERSSLGTPGAKALRERTPPEVVERIMRKVDELDRTIFICPVCEAVIEGDQPCPNGPHSNSSSGGAA